MQSKEIRKRFLAFFEKRGHAVIPSASLVPENDPSVLFTTAGMQPLIPYILGERHPQGKRLADVQKCVRTQDIEEVGDKTHDTFFEMLGNWSFGDYFKKEAITWSYEFLTSKNEGLGLDPRRLYITCFKGDADAPKDEESASIWKSLGIPEKRIYFQGRGDNWWSPGDNGPSGPDTEMFYDTTEEGLGDLSFEEFQKADDEQGVVELWNDVFMEYEKKDGKVIGKLAQKNVDTGAGLERLAMVMQNTDDIFETDLFKPLMNKIHELSKKNDGKAKRIVADHIRTAVFIIADGVTPSNTDRGYIVRRLIRRAVRYSDLLGMREGSLVDVVSAVITKYEDIYVNLKTEEKKIKEEIATEEKQFRVTLKKGLAELNKIFPIGGGVEEITEGKPIKTANEIDPQKAFFIYQTYGFPLELIEEELARQGLFVDMGKLREEFRKHQELSRIGAGQKFKGGLAGESEREIWYHTATHLLHQALRDVLGTHVAQRGSNITEKRLRFDFSHKEKMTEEEIARVERIVNEKIKAALPVQATEMSVTEARKKGAIGLFEERYGERVLVYQIGDEKTGIYSLEVCGGPHVKNTAEIQGVFKITKEEAVAAGIRRVKATITEGC